MARVTTGTAQNFSYVYDRWGNRWNQTVTAGSGPQPAYTFNTATNQITTSGFAYDAAGNMTNDSSHTYTYDAEGNITAVDSGSTATYIYNALNQRVRTIVGSATTEFVFNGNGLRVSVWNGSTKSVLREQYYFGGKPVAFYSASATHFQHQDWLGTERLRTTYNGAVEGSFKSLPFGDAYASTGSDLDPYHYAQLDYDSETTTSHAQFRQYSSTQGHWLSPDPYIGSYDRSNPQSMDRYAYVLNSPIANTDSLGLVTQPSWIPSPLDYLGGGYPVGTNWNEFDVMQIPVVQFEYGWVSMNVPMGDFSFPGGDATLTMTGMGWGYFQVGTGLDLVVGSGIVAPQAQPVPHWAFAGAVTIPITPGLLVDIPVAYIPGTNQGCAGLGIAVGSPGVGLSGGAVYSPQNIQDVISGPSVSFSAQAGLLGVQTAHNSSGGLYGNSMGTPGVAVGITYSGCIPMTEE